MSSLFSNFKSIIEEKKDRERIQKKQKIISKLKNEKKIEIELTIKIVDSNNSSMCVKLKLNKNWISYHSQTNQIYVMMNVMLTK